MKSYRTALIGLGINGENLIKHILQNEMFDLCAISEKSRTKCEQIHEQFNITSYDDSRQLILNEKPDIIILNLPNYLCGELIHTAAGIGCNIIKRPPLARDISEAQEWITATQKAKCVLALNCINRTKPITQKIINTIKNKTIGKVYLVSINYFTQFKGVFDWRGEPKLSGGGVLLEGVCDKIDLIKETMGLPNRVFAIKSDLCKKNSIPPYMTEDSCVVTMEYNDNVIANICCGWMAGTEKETISYYGTEGSIHATDSEFRLLNRQNEQIEYFTSDCNNIDLTISQLENFAGHLENPDLILNCCAKSYLETIALINTAYLSSITKSPEEPSKLISHL